MGRIQSLELGQLVSRCSGELVLQIELPYSLNKQVLYEKSFA